MQRSLEIAGTFGAVHRSHAAWFAQSFTAARSARPMAGYQSGFGRTRSRRPVRYQDRAACRGEAPAVLGAARIRCPRQPPRDSRRPGGTFTVRIESCPGAHIRIEVEDGGGPWLPRAPTQAAAAGLTSSACSAPLLACARRAASPDVRLT